MAALRHHKFHSLAELNEAIAELLERLNHRPLSQTRGYARLACSPNWTGRHCSRLPAERYIMAEWKTVRANIDYHVEVDRHYYSVPYQLAGQQTGSPLHRHHRGDLPWRQASRFASAQLAPLTATRPFPSTCPRATRRIWNGRLRG